VQHENKKLIWPRGELDFSAGCLIMGILNVTPDSFSDGGLFFNKEDAIEHGLYMAGNGASIIDVGGESSRPGSRPVAEDQQIKRIVPVIKALAGGIKIPISVDSYCYNVVRAALDIGAGMINDITALEDSRIGELAVEYKVPLVLMHMQGKPLTMQKEPVYKDLVAEVLKYLVNRAEKAMELGIAKDMIFIDPGIGFGKTFEHNLLLLRHIEEFVKTGYRVLVGTSRKSFIGKLTAKEQIQERVFGTAATVALCAIKGVSIVRVHDIAEMKDVIDVCRAIETAGD
jgi:dihydropteroate synthase